MKRIAILLLLCILLTGCGQAQKDPTLTHFTMVRENTVISLDTLAAPLLEALGAPFGYAENAASGGSGVEKTYRFSGLSLKTYPAEGGDRISSVSITDSRVSTSEGITVGSTADQVRACYGPNSIRSNRCIVSSAKEALVLLLQNDVVMSIQYTLL